MEPRRVHVLGASGAGVTTLGRALADAWSVPHADVDDYYWEPTEPPYTTKRDPESRLQLMEEVFVPLAAWVLSGSMVSWGESLVPRFDAVIFLTLDPAVRLERLRRREQRRYGARIAPDGDRRLGFTEFIDWAAGYDDPNFGGRSRVIHERWSTTLPCPVLRLDSARPVSDSVMSILDWAP